MLYEVIIEHEILISTNRVVTQEIRCCVWMHALGLQKKLCALFFLGASKRGRKLRGLNGDSIFCLNWHDNDCSIVVHDSKTFFLPDLYSWILESSKRKKNDDNKTASAMYLAVFG